MVEVMRPSLAERRQGEKIGVGILAAGIAQRLEPLSSLIAKPAFPLGGRVPVAELWVRKFIDIGIERIVMNLHRVPDSIQDYFKNGDRFQADISYLYEEVPSGTLGGAIQMVKSFNAQGFYPERIFIPSGDIASGITSEQLEYMLACHEKRGAAFTMMLAPIPWERLGDFGTVVLESCPTGEDVAPGTFARVVDFVEKDPASPSNMNNASNYLIETDFLMELAPHLTEARIGIEQGFYDFGKHLFMGMKGKVPYLDFLEKFSDELYGYEPGAPWFDIGTKRDYLAVNEAVLKEEIAVEMPYARQEWGWLGREVELTLDKTVINLPVVIGDHCRIEPGAELGPHVILGDGWTVEAGARIRNSVFWPDFGHGAKDREAGFSGGGPRSVAAGVSIADSIVVKGYLDQDIVGKTVDCFPGGGLDIRSIDQVSDEPRV